MVLWNSKLRKGGGKTVFNLIIGLGLLLFGGIFMFKFLGSSPSLKKRDEDNKKNPMDESSFPSNRQGNDGL